MFRQTIRTTRPRWLDDNSEKNDYISLSFLLVIFFDTLENFDALETINQVFWHSSKRDAFVRSRSFFLIVVVIVLKSLMWFVFLCRL